MNVLCKVLIINLFALHLDQRTSSLPFVYSLVNVMVLDTKRVKRQQQSQKFVIEKLQNYYYIE